MAFGAEDDRDFPAQAEALRRAGRASDALEVAAAGVERTPERIEGRVSLALALLDLGDVAAARRELEEGLDTLIGEIVPVASAERVADVFDGPLGGDEIDDAFGRAEAEPEHMVSANDIAQRALEQTMDGDVTADAGAWATDEEAVWRERIATTLEGWLANLRRREA